VIREWLRRWRRNRWNNALEYERYYLNEAMDAYQQGNERQMDIWAKRYEWARDHRPKEPFNDQSA
jgi:hypothetical protein